MYEKSFNRRYHISVHTLSEWTTVNMGVRVQGLLSVRGEAATPLGQIQISNSRVRFCFAAWKLPLERLNREAYVRRSALLGFGSANKASVRATSPRTPRKVRTRSESRRRVQGSVSIYIRNRPATSWPITRTQGSRIESYSWLALIEFLTQTLK